MSRRWLEAAPDEALASGKGVLVRSIWGPLQRAQAVPVGWDPPKDCAQGCVFPPVTSVTMTAAIVQACILQVQAFVFSPSLFRIRQ